MSSVSTFDTQIDYIGIKTTTPPGTFKHLLLKSNTFVCILALFSHSVLFLLNRTHSGHESKNVSLLLKLTLKVFGFF